jgi:hypothetical protein
MKMDIYYSTESQDKFGKEVQSWMFDRSVIGYAEPLGAVERDSLKNDQFFEYENKLIGRTKEDPRISLEGFGYPITSIIITNIRNGKTDQEFYTESYGKNPNTSTLYEILSVEPYINPWNEIEYYKILFNRSDRQEMRDAQC